MNVLNDVMQRVLLAVIMIKRRFCLKIYLFTLLFCFLNVFVKFVCLKI